MLSAFYLCECKATSRDRLFRYFSRAIIAFVYFALNTSMCYSFFFFHPKEPLRQRSQEVFWNTFWCDNVLLSFIFFTPFFFINRSRFANKHACLCTYSVFLSFSATGHARQLLQLSEKRNSVRIEFDAIRVQKASADFAELNCLARQPVEWQVSNCFSHRVFRKLFLFIYRTSSKKQSKFLRVFLFLLRS